MAKAQTFHEQTNIENTLKLWEVLKTLPDESVDMCVTSPPYYGLRDYGTGEWVGGDPNCPHKRLNKVNADNCDTGHAQEGLIGNVGDSIYKTVCPLCGAVRVDKQIGLEETPEQYIEKLVNCGVNSFKIEGRLKDVSYVKNVVLFYNNLKERPLHR